MIECKKLSKNYGTKAALKNIELKLQKGKIIGLLGSNGSGKTTLIKLMTGLLSPTNGEILINNEKPGINSKKIISYLPESNALDLNMTVEEVLKYFKDFFEDFDEKKAEKLLESFEINKNDKLVYLSKGTKEKLQLVLCISRKVSYYILDEPIGGVDPAARDKILDTILNNFSKNATVIISTHLISDIEKILDEVIFINKGEILIHENADKLREKRKKSIDAIFREDFKC